MNPRPVAGRGGRLLQLLLVLACCVMGAAPLRAEPGRAGELFAALRPAVVQIRVIDLASGDKASLGSGFQISADGLVATNFHVVADAAHEPGRYRLEYPGDDGVAVPLQLLDVDVVHDLAVLRAATPLPGALVQASAELAQGERIFSMGNPLDLAMTIVEGTYNGFVEGARYRKILFSGSLNPGMSGGPALNQRGEVVGINVSHGGEQISFLVPVSYLAALQKRALDPERAGKDMASRITDALLEDQDAYFGALLAEPWDSRPLGHFRVPGSLGPSVQCWGGSDEIDEELFAHIGQECGSDDTVFVGEDLQTGGLRYSFHAYSTEDLGLVRFYSLLDGQYAHSEWFAATDAKQVGSFDCREDFLEGRGIAWRISVCARRYTELPGLFDMSVVMATTAYPQEGLVANLALNGVSEPRAREFLRRFVESVSWAP